MNTKPDGPQGRRKGDGFWDEQFFIIPTESFIEYAGHPLIRPLYLTDVGYFPHALHHYCERDEGCDAFILIYCTHGRGVIEMEDGRFEIGPDEAFCIPRNLRHRYYAHPQDPWSIFWIHFKGENAHLFPLEDRRVVSMASGHAVDRMMFLFSLLFRVAGGQYTEGNFIYMSQVLSLLLAEVYHREKADTPPGPNRHLTVIVRYMVKHLTGQLTLADLSREFGLSKSYINAIFQSSAQQAPIQFFIRLKMQEARKLLKSTTLPVAEVAARLGYDDPYYFSRLFKKSVGLTPRAYRAAGMDAPAAQRRPPLP